MAGSRLIPRSAVRVTLVVFALLLVSAGTRQIFIQMDRVCIIESRRMIDDIPAVANVPSWWTLSMADEYGDFRRGEYMNISIPAMKADLLVYQAIPVVRDVKSNNVVLRMLAFLLEWEAPLLKGVAALQHNAASNIKVSCSFQWPTTGSFGYPNLATLRIYSNDRYLPMFIECQLPDAYATALLPRGEQPSTMPLPLPVKLSVLSSSGTQVFTAKPQTILHFDWTKMLTRGNIELAACVSIVATELDTRRWVELLEYHKHVAQIEHIFVYALDKSFRLFFQRWINEGYVSFIHWIQPETASTSTDAGRFLQITAMNDCVMRARHVADWVAFLDENELLVVSGSVHEASAVELVRSVDRDVSSLLIPRVVIRQPPGGAEPNATRFSWTVRSHASKSGQLIVRPSSVVCVDTKHVVTTESGSLGSLGLDPREAMIYSYDLEGTSYEGMEDSVEDVITKYRSMLEKVVAKRQGELVADKIPNLIRLPEKPASTTLDGAASSQSDNAANSQSEPTKCPTCPSAPACPPAQTEKTECPKVPSKQTARGAIMIQRFRDAIAIVNRTHGVSTYERTICKDSWRLGGRWKYQPEHLVGTTCEPWMARDTIQVLSKILSPDMDGLEWSSGSSTLWLLVRMRSLISIEDSKEWMGEVVKRVGSIPAYARASWSWKVIPGAETGSKEHKSQMRGGYFDEYVRFPTTLNRTFDFVSVDGRARPSCLREGIKLVRPEGGILIIDNSEREHYQDAIREVPRRWPKFIGNGPKVLDSTTIWITCTKSCPKNSQ